MLEELLSLQELGEKLRETPPARRPVASLLHEAGKEAQALRPEEEHEEWTLPSPPARQEPTLYSPAARPAQGTAFAPDTAARTAGITAGVTMDIYEASSPAQEEKKTGPQPREVLYPRQRRVALREISDEMEFESRQYPRVEEDF